MPVPIAPTHGRMARLSWAAWLICLPEGCHPSPILTGPHPFALSCCSSSSLKAKKSFLQLRLENFTQLHARTPVICTTGPVLKVLQRRPKIFILETKISKLAQLNACTQSFVPLHDINADPNSKGTAL